VGDAARQEGEAAGSDDGVGGAADDPDLALEDLQQLVLGVVDVQRRPELRRHEELGRAHAAVLDPFGRQLDGDACAHLPDVVALSGVADDGPGVCGGVHV
jgi:hypothetical protein